MMPSKGFSAGERNEIAEFRVCFVQHCCLVVQQVYQSLKKSGECSPITIKYFDVEGGDLLLYELRFLSAELRASAAKYIADGQLEPQVRRTKLVSFHCHGRCHDRQHLLPSPFGIP